jgi:hypothetical protein
MKYLAALLYAVADIIMVLFMGYWAVLYSIGIGCVTIAAISFSWPRRYRAIVIGLMFLLYIIPLPYLRGLDEVSVRIWLGLVSDPGFLLARAFLFLLPTAIIIAAATIWRDVEARRDAADRKALSDFAVSETRRHAMAAWGRVRKS